MNVHLCVHKVSPHAYVCMHECVRAIREYPQRSGRVSFSWLFGHFRWFAGRHGPLPPPLKTQTVRLCLSSVLFGFGPEVKSSK